MQDSTDKLPSRERIPRLSERSRPPEKEAFPPQDRVHVSCPFCGKTGARFRLMDSMHYSGGVVGIAYFTCISCSQDWSMGVAV